jgi:two-component system NtrC family sensor kinase
MTRNIYSTILFVFILYCTQSLSQSKAQFFEFKAEQNNGQIGDFVTITTLDDNSNPVSIKGVQKVINIGSNNKTVTIGFSLINRTELKKIIIHISNPIIDSLAYQIKINGKKTNMGLHTQFSMNKRDYKHQNFIIPFEIDAGDTAEIKLTVNSSTPIIVPIDITDEYNLLKNISLRDLISGIYFGIMLIMFLYNLFIYFAVRDISYIYYVNYILGVAITQGILHGYANRFFWPNNEWLSLNMVPISGAVVGIFTIFFVKSFLQTKQNTPKLNILLNIIIIIDLIGLLLGILEYRTTSYSVVDITAGLGSIIVLTIATKMYRKGSRAAGFFLLSWSVFLFSVIIFVLKNYGILPYNLFTVHSMQFGSAIEASLLSFALADKINTYRKEKDKAQVDALQVAQENEKIVRDQNIMLETKVTERTQELVLTNSNLEVALDDLKQTQSQLVEQEKMASLGQLTAGIAHEINNPINFVSSNVNPLKRDFNMLIELFSRIEVITKDDTDVQVKMNQISSLKKEFDYDYLTGEIFALLKGIEEGSTRTAEIVKGLRIFSRLDEDDIKKADLNEGIESTLTIIYNQLSDKIKVNKKFDDIPLLECYPGKLNQVILNLLTNSIYAINKKYENKPGGLISIATSRDPENVYINIEDNGIGMNEETKQKIFEPFYTTKPVGEGTGLGMSIVYNTIRKHNGEISLSSELGKGTTFVIKLPISQ